MTELPPSIQPAWVAPGGDLEILGERLPLGPAGPPRVTVGGEPVRVKSASTERLRVTIPVDHPGGLADVRIEGHAVELGQVLVGRTLTTGVHLVDSPAFDGLGRLHVTESGSRGVKVSVPIFRVRADGGRDPVAVEIANPTSLVLGPDGAIYVSSRFEGQVYRLGADDRVELFAAELGVPTGLAFGSDGALFVGDRSGSILRVSTDRRVETFATLPASVAAFHLAFGPDEHLYVTAPTLASQDALYRISPGREVEVVYRGFGRPQGLAFSSDGMLYLADALAGAAALYRLDVAQPFPVPEHIANAPMAIGVTLDPAGGVVLAASDRVWFFDAPVLPIRRAAHRS